MTVTTISSSLTHGVVLGQGNYGVTLTITNAGKITAPAYGIYGPESAGGITINNAGTIHAGTVGVEASLYGSILNSGQIYGSEAGLVLAAGQFVNTGIISGKTIGVYAGGYALSIETALSISNAAAAGIIATDIGVLLNPARGQNVTFNNSGTISGQISGLYFIESNSPYATATIDNNAGGLITAQNGVGVYLTVASGQENVTFNNAGTVSGKISGAYIYNSTFNNTAIVTGNTYGIAVGSGLVSNSGTIFGSKDGISLGTLAATIINDGTISGGTDAIYGRHAFTLGVDPGAVFIGNIIDKSSNGELSLQGTNAATLSGIGTSFQGFSTLAFAPGSQWTAEGNIAGLATGETITGFTIGDSIILDGFSATSESVNTTGLILSNGTSAETLDIHSAEFLQNFSLTSAASASTITFETITSLTSIISSYTPFEVRPGYRYFSKTITITNTGAAPSVYTSTQNFGANIVNYGDILNGTKLFEANLDNFGTISGNQPIYDLAYTNVTNSGSIIISSTTQAGIFLRGGELSNSGYIYSKNEAIYSGFGNVSNTGTIIGTVSSSNLFNGGLISNTDIIDTSHGSGTFDNSGTIIGTNIGISLNGGRVINTGTISGKIDGIAATGGAITDYGTISGGTYAIYNQNSALNLTIEPTTKLIGAVKDASNLGTLTFAKTSSGRFDLGTSFAGFADVDFAAGSTWTVEGSTHDLANGQIISGFTSGETIILDNFAATSDSFVVGAGLVLSNGSINETLGLLGSLSQLDFNVSNAVGNTTIVSNFGSAGLVTTINTNFDRRIILGQGYYTNTLTITNAGAIIPSVGTVAIDNSPYAFYTKIDNFGSIAGGIYLQGSTTIVNAGTVHGNVGIHIETGNIYNSGLVTQAGYTNPNVAIVDLEGTIVNSGTIINDKEGIYLNSGTVINTGYVAGSLEAISIAGGDLVNAGTIAGNVGSEFYLNVTIDPGAVFLGTVMVPTGTLALAGTPSNIVNIGSSFIGFSDIEFLPGTSAILEGNSISIAHGQVISGFTSGNTIILNSLVATTDSFVVGTGLILGSGANATTLAMDGNLSLADFGISSHSGNTTIISKFEPIVPLTTISTIFTKEIYLGSTYYGTNLTITNTGAVLVPTGPAIQGYITASNLGITNYGTVGRVDLSSGSVINHGVIDAPDAIKLTTGTIINFGLITGAGFGPSYVYGIDSSSNVNVINAGTIMDDSNGIDLLSGTVLNTGTISSSKDAVIIVTSADVTNSGLISGGVYIGFGTLAVDPGGRFAGTVRATSSTLALAGTTTGSLDIGTSFTGFTHIDFNQGSTWSLESGSIGIAAGQTINGFALGDTIILDGFVVNTLDTTYVTGVGLELTGTLGNHLTLDITGNFTTASFSVTDPPGNTTIALCYLRGTKIATPTGNVAIETLETGDIVITRFSGYQKIKWIGRQSYAKRFVQNNRDQIPVCIAAHALGPNRPVRDLSISPGHSVLIDGVLVLAKNLVNGITIRQHDLPDEIHYYQLEFEQHDCVMAEGVWAESYADTPDYRNKFHNVAEFWALYPDHQAPNEQWLCAPRPLAGPALAKALSPITTRAAALTKPGTLRGYIDEISESGLIRGWAWDEMNPELPVLLQIRLGNRHIGSVLACDYRQDLHQAGFGQGNCAFSFTSSIGLPASPQHLIQIYRAADGAAIKHTATPLPIYASAS